MIVLDKNQLLQPPSGYMLRGVAAEGSYLRLEYTLNARPTEIVDIYLNDQGREVLRCQCVRRPIGESPEKVYRWAGQLFTEVETPNRVVAVLRSFWKFLLECPHGR